MSRGRIHERYGKALLRLLVRDRFHDRGPEVQIQYFGEVRAAVDGVLAGRWAVEIESREDKQIRGALVDLLHHRLPKKLLILIPANMFNPEATKRRCLALLEALRRPEHTTHVMSLEGNGKEPKFARDLRKLKGALRQLGCLVTGRRGTGRYYPYVNFPNRRGRVHQEGCLHIRQRRFPFISDTGFWNAFVNREEAFRVLEALQHWRFARDNCPCVRPSYLDPVGGVLSRA